MGEAVVDRLLLVTRRTDIRKHVALLTGRDTIFVIIHEIVIEVRRNIVPRQRIIVCRPQRQGGTCIFGAGEYYP